MPLLFFPVYSPTSCCNCSLFLFRVHMGMCPSPTFLWSMPHFSCHWKPSPLQAHWGRWCHSCLLCQACLFTIHVRECSSPPLWWSFPHDSCCYKLSPLQGCWVGAAPAFLASLCIYSSMRDFPSLPLWHSGCPALFATCLFCCYCLLFSFFSLFSLGEGQFVQGAMLICSRAVSGSTTCHLAHLVVCFFQAG
jgi:hypothetical protein